MIAYLFPGQGAQYVGMGRDLYDSDSLTRELFDGLQCDFDIKAMCFDGPEETLSDTRYSQVCIFVVSLAIARLLAKAGIHPEGAAGLSLGEYGALCLAGSFSDQTAVRLLADRGRIMADYIPRDSGMAAIVGLDAATVQAYCNEVEAYGVCQIGGYNSPLHATITGTNAAIDQCMTLCRQNGAKLTVRINTSGAFHSSLAAPATAQLAKTLEGYDIQNPQFPVYYNYDGTTKCPDIKAMEADQLQHPVQFIKTIKNMMDDGYSQFVVLGPSHTIASFVRDIARHYQRTVVVHIVEHYSDIAKTAQKLGA